MDDLVARLRQAGDPLSLEAAAALVDVRMRLMHATVANCWAACWWDGLNINRALREDHTAANQLAQLRHGVVVPLVHLEPWPARR